MGFLLDSDIEEIAGSLGETAQAFNGKRILITGARGFLGRYFTDVFLKLNEKTLKDPCEIIAIDNLRTSGELGAEIPKERSNALILFVSSSEIYGDPDPANVPPTESYHVNV